MKKKQIKAENDKKTIIAAVVAMDQLDAAIKSSCGIIFLLTGNVFNLKNAIDSIHAVKKKVYIDIDLMEGFARDVTFLKYIQEVLLPDGIVTTRNNLAKKAKVMGLFVIQRFFIFDSMSLESSIKSILEVKPDVVEILPGVSVKVIRQVKEKTRWPVIGSGLITCPKEVENALGAGAMGVTTSNFELWNEGF